MRRKKKVRQFKVLVVDENPETGVQFQQALRSPQAVTWVSGGQEALEKLKESPYAMVFLRAHPGEESEAELVETIKATAPDTVVVMMSEQSIEKEVQMAVASSAQQAAGKLFEEGDEIMTIQEVARYLSLHELTVRRLAREGELPAFKIGRQWRVKRNILDRWIERETMRNIGEGEAENA